MQLVVHLLTGSKNTLTVIWASKIESCIKEKFRFYNIQIIHTLYLTIRNQW